MRPLHEEMTTSLLEEVQKRRAKKTSRMSTSRDSSAFATAVLAATAANTANADDSPVSGGVAALTAAGTTSERPAFGGKTIPSPGAAPPPGKATTPAAADTLGAHSLNTAALAAKLSEAGSIGGDALGAAGQTPLVEEGRVQAAQTGGETATTMKRSAEAERRRAALATIGKHRSHRHTASGASHVAVAAATAPGTDTTGRSTTVQESEQDSSSHAGAAASVASAGKRSRSFSAAFSRQSVRSGETLGYYGREEVDVLSAISKNPSRIAAYNRITEGKTGNKENGPSPEVILVGVVRRQYYIVLCQRGGASPGTFFLFFSFLRERGAGG